MKGMVNSQGDLLSLELTLPTMILEELEVPRLQQLYPTQLFIHMPGADNTKGAAIENQLRNEIKYKYFYVCIKIKIGPKSKQRQPESSLTQRKSESNKHAGTLKSNLKLTLDLTRLFH